MRWGSSYRYAMDCGVWIGATIAPYMLIPWGATSSGTTLASAYARIRFGACSTRTATRSHADEGVADAEYPARGVSAHIPNLPETLPHRNCADQTANACPRNAVAFS